MGLLFSLLLPLLAAGVTIIPLLPPGPGNPRNTEGAFVTLRDGRILFAYSRFTGGDDNDAATIAGRYSKDGGRTWSTTDVPIVAKEGDMNVMSVSLLRLKAQRPCSAATNSSGVGDRRHPRNRPSCAGPAEDGRIALFYLRKNSVGDCRPYVRYSRDEAKTWSEPVLCIRDEGYYVLNNDRVVQLRGGRLLMPVAMHPPVNGRLGSRGIAMVYYSDDNGGSWRRSKSTYEAPGTTRAGFQEPGVVELKDGRVMMFIRTMLGSQYLSWSSDGGDTWSVPEPSSIASPLAPASIKRIPKTGDLLMVWNDHSAVEASFRATEKSGGKRTPLTVAISRDDGKTWVRARNIREEADGWYCYTAIHFDGPRVLLGFVDGGHGLPGLSRTSIAWFKVSELYGSKTTK